MKKCVFQLILLGYFGDTQPFGDSPRNIRQCQRRERTRTGQIHHGAIALGHRVAVNDNCVFSDENDPVILNPRLRVKYGFAAEIIGSGRARDLYQ